MLDAEKMRERFKRFKKVDYGTYPYCFGEFWKWKLRTENESEHILDDRNTGIAYGRLGQTLKIWQWHRPYAFAKFAPGLKKALVDMQESYNQIRKFSLLEFDKIPEDQLERVWHELGSVKNLGKNAGGYYSVMATTKPLMFLWGQTPAFDSVVRGYMPRLGIPGLTDWKWDFDTWKKVMMKFALSLKEQPEIINLFKELSLEEYGTDDFVPYGQFIDLYYWARCR